MGSEEVSEVDVQCNAIIEEAMRRVSTLRGSMMVYALAYCAENDDGTPNALHYVSNAGRRGAINLLRDCQRGLTKQNRRLDS